MSATKVNLSQLVDLAVVTPREGAVNSNVLHTLTLLHAMLRQLNIVDVQAETNLSDYDRDLLSGTKTKTRIITETNRTAEGKSSLFSVYCIKKRKI